MDDWPFLVDKMDSMNSLVDFNLFTKISGQINTGGWLSNLLKILSWQLKVLQVWVDIFSKWISL